MSQIRSFLDLLGWQKSMQLVPELYRIISDFPKSERYGLPSQLRRAAVSAPNKIAEGYGRHSTNDYIRFLRIAIGSLYEMQTQVESAANLVSVSKNACHEFIQR